MLTYYIYRHISVVDGNPFYIGFGTNRGGFDYSRASSKCSRSNEWHEIAKHGYFWEIMFESECRVDVINKEIFFISYYGRIGLDENGILTNKIGGGAGGYILSEQHKKKISQSVKRAIEEGRLFNKSHRKSISESKKGHEVTKETRDKLRRKLYRGGRKNKTVREKVVKKEEERYKETNFSKNGIQRIKEAKSRPVFCENNGVTYSSILEASNNLPISIISAHRILSGKYPSVKGIKIKYADGL